MDISTSASRRKLAIRREPYWEVLSTGVAVGFRRGADTWVARYRDRRGQRHYEALPHGIDYETARRETRVWAERMSQPGKKAKRGTVHQALQAYIEDLRDRNRPETAADLEVRFAGYLWPDKLARMRLEAATIDDVTAWVRRLRDGRCVSTVERYLTAVRAGIHRALELGWTGDREAWKLERPSNDAQHTSQAVFLSREQRVALLEGCPDQTRAFFLGLECTGARPLELSRATVADYNAEAGSLRLWHRKGRPSRLRERFVQLDRTGVQLVEQLSKGRASGALLFPSPRGRAWTRWAWAHAFKKAVAVAKANGALEIPKKATAYALRHSRISELLQLHGIDPVTIAQQTGTSVTMISKHYAKFIPHAMKAKLQELG